MIVNNNGLDNNVKNVEYFIKRFTKDVFLFFNDYG